MFSRAKHPRGTAILAVVARASSPCPTTKTARITSQAKHVLKKTFQNLTNSQPQISHSIPLIPLNRHKTLFSPFRPNYKLEKTAKICYPILYNNCGCTFAYS